MDIDYIFKILVIGNSSVGKTCLIHQFIEEKYIEDVQSTVGMEYGSKTITLGKRKIKVELWDTAGQEAFKSITRSYYRSSAAAILVYDVSSKETFDGLNDWIKEAEENGNESMILAFAANKIDVPEGIFFRVFNLQKGEK